VSSVDSIAGAAISAGNLKSLALSDRWSQYGKLIARANRIRGYGDFLHYHLLASGKIDAVIESDVNILDIAATVVIIEAAGGKFTQLDGGAVNPRRRRCWRRITNCTEPLKAARLMYGAPYLRRYPP